MNLSFGAGLAFHAASSFATSGASKGSAPGRASPKAHRAGAGGAGAAASAANPARAAKQQTARRRIRRQCRPADPAAQPVRRPGHSCTVPARARPCARWALDAPATPRPVAAAAAGLHHGRARGPAPVGGGALARLCRHPRARRHRAGRAPATAGAPAGRHRVQGERAQRGAGGALRALVCPARDSRGAGGGGGGGALRDRLGHARLGHQRLERSAQHRPGARGAARRGGGPRGRARCAAHRGAPGGRPAEAGRAGGHRREQARALGPAESGGRLLAPVEAGRRQGADQRRRRGDAAAREALVRRAAPGARRAFQAAALQPRALPPGARRLQAHRSAPVPRRGDPAGGGEVVSQGRLGRGAAGGGEVRRDSLPRGGDLTRRRHQRPSRADSRRARPHPAPLALPPAAAPATPTIPPSTPPVPPSR